MGGPAERQVRRQAARNAQDPLAATVAKPGRIHDAVASLAQAEHHLGDGRAAPTGPEPRYE